MEAKADSLEGLARNLIIDHRQDQQNHRSGNGQETEDRMEKEDDGQKNRRPGRIQDREDSTASEKIPQNGDVPQPLRPWRLLCNRGQAQAGGEGAVRQLPFEPEADRDQGPAAHDIERRHDHERSQRQHSQVDQRVDTAATEHTIEDLQHEQRRGQHENVDAQTE